MGIADSRGGNDEERALRRGSLKISYYKELSTGQARARDGSGIDGRWEEKQSHVKCYIFDGEVTVLGSGNGDRASWWTSLEVNVVIFGQSVATEVRRELGRYLDGRLEELHV